jgi:hypothetical protein
VEPLFFQQALLCTVFHVSLFGIEKQTPRQNCMRPTARFVFDNGLWELMLERCCCTGPYIIMLGAQQIIQAANCKSLGLWWCVESTWDALADKMSNSSLSARREQCLCHWCGALEYRIRKWCSLRRECAYYWSLELFKLWNQAETQNKTQTKCSRSRFCNVYI